MDSPSDWPLSEITRYTDSSAGTVVLIMPVFERLQLRPTTNLVHRTDFSTINRTGKQEETTLYQNGGGVK